MLHAPLCNSDLYRRWHSRTPQRHNICSRDRRPNLGHDTLRWWSLISRDSRKAPRKGLHSSCWRHGAQGWGLLGGPAGKRQAYGRYWVVGLRSGRRMTYAQALPHLLAAVAAQARCCRHDRGAHLLVVALVQVICGVCVKEIYTGEEYIEGKQPHPALRSWCCCCCQRLQFTLMLPLLLAADRAAADQPSPTDSNRGGSRVAPTCCLHLRQFHLLSDPACSTRLHHRHAPVLHLWPFVSPPPLCSGAVPHGCAPPSTPCSNVQWVRPLQLPC